MEPVEKISAWWWLVPFFLAFIGGIIDYIVLKDRNRKTAENMLIFGIAWTLPDLIFVAFITGFIAGMLSG